MDTFTPFQQVPGENTEERFAALGIRAGETVDLLALKEIGERGDVEVWIYFDEEVAAASTIERDLANFEFVPEPDRPFIELRRFFAFMESIEPGFERSLADTPVRAQIVAVGEREAFCGCVLSPRPYVKAALE
ncbi:MAG: hypothetical protein PHU26_05140 [Methanofollis liminatans]|jgi:hypothetical protein|uniref:Uncharacterized protein n=1 Tax=Methanofollis liminatans DSM 4140 TaxID=28892 RepID=J1L029_9EURY|nr:hypothetical protein [Methanofollis liminatans]EJG06327.1 hypothetical protein Metli_0359 [Methanofollis liminatans DSM 4140]MDD3111663.1 hypothetical protein [Methanofollis liminatans]